MELNVRVNYSNSCRDNIYVLVLTILVNDVERKLERERENNCNLRSHIIKLFNLSYDGFVLPCNISSENLRTDPLN